MTTMQNFNTWIKVLCHQWISKKIIMKKNRIFRVYQINWDALILKDNRLINKNIPICICFQNKCQFIFEPLKLICCYLTTSFFLAWEYHKPLFFIFQIFLYEEGWHFCKFLIYRHYYLLLTKLISPLV